ncbi:MAG TPA: peptidoglycan-binding domain-containing protein [Candidatus Paceibacterota bacterium]
MKTHIHSHLAAVALGVGALVIALVVGMNALSPAAHARAAITPLTASLQLGSSGTDVSQLQSFLAQSPSIYPLGLVTGFFGPLTRSAVMRFQTAYGISPVGRVGPQTLAKINSLIASGGTLIGATGTTTSTTSSTATVPTVIGTTTVSTTGTSATIRWMSSQPARGTVYYASTPITTFEVSSPTMQPVVTPGASVSETGFSTAHSITLSNLTPNTTYYYATVTTNQAGLITVTLTNTFRTGTSTGSTTGTTATGTTGTTTTATSTTTH